MTNDYLKTLQKTSGDLPFSAPMFARVNHKEAVRYSLEILERAQAECLDRPIDPLEIEDAICFLQAGSGKTAYHCMRFQKGLLIQDQSQRFEVTAAALRQIRAQFAF